ncbi:MAG TPA: adenylate/guanylate cyclase domain-containing protein [Chthoniobacteraceae bacterium]|nr:adenylate/guanylate cyclase domain-containing protein [Chthoniobacteraceae bacterium]
MLTYAPMGAKLHVQPARAEPFELAIGNTVTIGRTRENTVCLGFSRLVSRQHAIIRCHNGYQYQIIDLGSRNGTFVDDQRVVTPILLADGARIRVADNLITFHETIEDLSGEQQLATLAGAGAADDSLQSRPVALLVCDIRGFSAMAEKTANGDLAQLLGIWFREAANLVSASGGIIDKFLGDSLLAYWANDASGNADCEAAVSAARRMVSLANERTWTNGDPFHVTVAVHYGRVTCSNVGLAADRDATIIGDAVNTVFRLEAVSKEIGEPIVLSEDVAAHLGGGLALRDFGERTLKGKSHSVRVFGIL